MRTRDLVSQNLYFIDEGGKMKPREIKRLFQSYASNVLFHSLKYLLNAYYMVSTVVGSGYLVVTQIWFCPHLVPGLGPEHSLCDLGF